MVQVTVEAREQGVGSDLGWTNARAGTYSVTEDTQAPSQPASVLWSGTIAFHTAPPAAEFRVVVREFEQIAIDPPAGTGRPANGLRLIYATTLPFDFSPEATP